MAPLRMMSTAEVKQEAEEEAPIVLPTNENSPELVKLRHTTAHVMAMAVQRLFPKAQVTIGPWIENGFYYDFDMQGEELLDKDLKAIKKEMIKIINKGFELRREVVPREEAKKRIDELGEPYKLELLDAIPEGEDISIYHVGDEWWDLCAGPHVETTKGINPKALELQRISGAYWRGDEKNKMLSRVYGTVWETPEQLKGYNKMMEEAKKRDHRKIGKEMDLFSIQESAGGGLVFWHPKGGRMRNIIENYWKEIHVENGYDLVYSPHVADVDLWKTSGHYDFYAESMFDTMNVEGAEYQIKPMNCPFHVLMYKDAQRSYRDLPLRWAELGTVYRYEKSGTLSGLFRVRGFTQDDAHVFCLPDQVADEIEMILDLTEAILSKFGFSDYEVNLSTRPEKSIGSDDIWEKAESALVTALNKKGWNYKVDEGGGAFYGPKIDLKIRDAVGRVWQCSTVQCDFNLPERFDLEYVSAESGRDRPIMIHRAIFGSVERFFGILVENYAGDFPLWFAPEQIRLLAVNDDVVPYCEEVVAKMKKQGLRATVDKQAASLGKKIRNAELGKVPLTAVVGVEERDNNSLSVRVRKLGDIGSFSVEQVMGQIKAAVDGNTAFQAPEK